MKKLILLLAPAMVLGLASCGSTPAASSSSEVKTSEESSIVTSEVVTSEESSSEEEYVLDLNVAAPKGAPAVALYKYVTDTEKVEVNATPSNVVAYLDGNSNKDIVIVPTNAGVTSIIKKNSPFKLASTVTFGNLFLAATGNDENGTLDADDYVAIFQSNNVPGKTFSYVTSDLALTNVHEIDEQTNSAAQCLISGKNSSDDNASVDYVLIAEPALVTAMKKNQKASIYLNLQEEYKEKSGDKPLMQASVFVSNSADEEKVDAFLLQLEKDVEEFMAETSIIDAYLGEESEEFVKSKFGANLEDLKSMTENGNRMGLGYAEAHENKSAIDNFVSLWGINETSEEIYYI